ncbi:MAG: ABC transporter substrate-binding protein [Tissierellia bacterium]|nr:ABC transporter substrate-binding protein [Tissierellia bacterium]
MKNKKLLSLVLVLLLTFSLVACGKKEEAEDVSVDTNSETIAETVYPLSIKDALGEEVVFEKAPERVVSLAPSNTENLYAVGAGETLVGRTDYCDYPAEVLEVESIGGFTDPNIEAILDKDPDLVLVSGMVSEDSIKTIKEVGINVVALDATSFDEVYSNIEKFGQIFDLNENSKKIIDEMKASILEISDKVKEFDKVSVFYEVWGDPLMSTGPNTFIDELITLANGENAAKIDEGFKNYSIEQLIEDNPEVYILPKDGGMGVGLSDTEEPEDLESATIELIKNREGYSAISAIENDRIYLVDGDTSTIPGPRLVLALEEFAECIHPEAFK